MLGPVSHLVPVHKDLKITSHFPECISSWTFEVDFNSKSELRIERLVESLPIQDATHFSMSGSLLIFHCFPTKVLLL